MRLFNSVCREGHSNPLLRKYCDQCGGALATKSEWKRIDAQTAKGSPGAPPSYSPPSVPGPKGTGFTFESGKPQNWWSGLSSTRRVVALAIGTCIASAALPIAFPNLNIVLSILFGLAMTIALGVLAVVAIRHLLFTGGTASRQIWLSVLALGALIGIGVVVFNYIETHNGYYRSGFETANSPETKKLLYADLGPFEFCNNLQILAKRSGANDSDADKTFDGCIAGLKELLGSREYERLLRAD